MSIITLLAFSNDLLDQVISITPKVIMFSAILATLIPESTPIIGALLHKAALNIGNAQNKV